MKKITLPTIPVTADGFILENYDVRDAYGALIQITGNAGGATVHAYGSLDATPTSAIELAPICLTTSSSYLSTAMSGQNQLYWIPPSGTISLEVSGWADPFEVIVMLITEPWAPGVVN